jgi:hypothetical protein
LDRKFIRAHWVFLAAQIAGFAWAIHWWKNLPAPGYAIGVLAVGAAIMSLHADMRPGQKAVWILFMGAFLFLEFRAIDSNEAAQRSARDEENAKFKAIADGITAAMQASQVQFATTVEKSNKILGGVQDNLSAVTGGRSFADFGVAANIGSGNPQTYPLLVDVYGKYPMKNVSAQIQKIEEARDPESLNRQMQSMHLIPLGDGTILPGPHFTGERLSRKIRHRNMECQRNFK